MEKPNEITIAEKNGITIFDIKGDVTNHSEPFFHEAYKKVSDQGASKILFKFDENAYINSGGIAVLIQIMAEMNKNKQHTGITGLSEHFKKVFKMVGIQKFATIHNTQDDAVKAMSELS